MNKTQNKKNMFPHHTEGDRPRSAGSARTALTGLQTLPLSTFDSSKGFQYRI